MSRSRKKTPSYSDYSRNYTKWAKRQASKVVRRYQGELTDGTLYKKLYCSYNIFDYKCVMLPKSAWDSKFWKYEESFRK